LITQLDATLEKAVSLFPDDLKMSSVNEKFRKFLSELNDCDDGGDNGDDGGDNGDDVGDDDDGDHDKDGGDKDAGEKDGDHDKDGADKDVVDKAVVDKDGGESVEPVNPSVLHEETHTIEQVKVAVSEEAQPTENPKNEGVVDVGVSTPKKNVSTPKEKVSTPGLSAKASVIFEGDDWWNDSEFIEVLDSLEKTLYSTKPHRSLADITPPRFSLLSQEYCETQDRNTVKPVRFPSLSPQSTESVRGKGLMNEASENAQADSDVISAKFCFYSPARLKKPSKFFVSPYRRRETSISAGISQLEWDVSGSVFIMQNDPR